MPSGPYLIAKKDKQLMDKFDINVRLKDSHCQVSIPLGETLFIVGANGSGKSGLMQNLYVQHRQNARRIAAHRQTWFASDAIDLSPHRKIQIERQIANSDTQADARWKEERASDRSSIAIYDLLDAENVRARSIASAVDKDDVKHAKLLSKSESRIAIINRLFRISNIPIEISIHENERILASKEGSDYYSIAELSDGERNALLVAVNVLTCPGETLILIDEPERHLHRSIISTFLGNLTAERPDCAFIVSTHDIALPMQNNEASKTLIIRGCEYENKKPYRWHADLVDKGLPVDTQTKIDILGARRRLVFVEGDADSLDKALYSLLFPGVSIVPKSSCKSVEAAVDGINSAEDLHWLDAWGLIDSDGRSTDDLADLEGRGIFALNCYSIESLYYDVKIIRCVANRLAEVDGNDPATRCSEAIKSALSSVGPHATRLSARIAEKKIREVIFGMLPSPAEMSSGGVMACEVNIRDYIEAERNTIEDFIEADNYEGILRRYPLRETPALGAVAKALGFQSRKQYESAVLKAVAEEEELHDYLLGIIGNISNVILENKMSNASAEKNVF